MRPPEVCLSVSLHLNQRVYGERDSESWRCGAFREQGSSILFHEDVGSYKYFFFILFPRPMGARRTSPSLSFSKTRTEFVRASSSRAPLLTEADCRCRRCRDRPPLLGWAPLSHHAQTHERGGAARHRRHGGKWPSTPEMHDQAV